MPSVTDEVQRLEKVYYNDGSFYKILKYFDLLFIKIKKVPICSFLYMGHVVITLFFRCMTRAVFEVDLQGLLLLRRHMFRNGVRKFINIVLFIISIL